MSGFALKTPKTQNQSVPYSFLFGFIQPSISSLMFTRLDAERNVKSMKRAVLTKRLSQDSYNTVIQEMNQYVTLPGRRLAELVKRYRHHCMMKEVGK